MAIVVSITAPQFESAAAVPALKLIRLARWRSSWRKSARTHTIINADMLHQKSNRDLRLTTIELITPIAAVVFSVTHIVSGDALSVLTRGLIGAARPETLGDFNLRRGAWYLNGWKSSRFFRCCQKREGSSHSLRNQISHQQVFHYCLWLWYLTELGGSLHIRTYRTRKLKITRTIRENLKNVKIASSVLLLLLSLYFFFNF